jgi:capsular polysaccharide biosynthesis protein
LDANRNDSNARRRQISNEIELSEKLKELGIETIFLEDYQIKEKIDIFNNSDLIISPNSGGLTFTIFSTENTKIIEINVDNPNQISHQYRDQCHALNVPYYKYTAQKLDSDDNMTIDVKDFCNFINENL